MTTFPKFNITAKAKSESESESEAKPNPKSAHSIKQPKLSTVQPNERVVKTAGLKFKLPNIWSEGSVLDAESALFINTAYHTTVLNRFAETRDALLNSPSTTYEDLDAALQAHFESYRWTPRPTKAPTDRELLTDEDKDLIAYARPVFNATFGKKGLPRKDYEAKLMQFVLDNKATLVKSMAAEQATMAKLLATLKKVQL